MTLKSPIKNHENATTAITELRCPKTALKDFEFSQVIGPEFWKVPK
jgi:hypothetical protein